MRTVSPAAVGSLAHAATHQDCAIAFKPTFASPLHLTAVQGR